MDPGETSTQPGGEGATQSFRGTTETEVEHDPGVEAPKKSQEEPQEEEVEESEKAIPQRIRNLQKDFTALVTNMQTAADLKESMRRTELEEAHRKRLERLENNMRSSQEQYEEIIGGWLITKEKVIPQELQKALNSQQQLCTALIENKKKLISELQQELKAADDRYVKDVRRHAEELDLMIERMEEQMQVLKKAYREEMTEIERVHLQESQVFLAKDKAEWEEHIRKLWEKEMERLTERKKIVEEYENTVHNLMLDAINKNAAIQIEQSEKFQVLEREKQELKGTNMLVGLKAYKQSWDMGKHNINWRHRKCATTQLKVIQNKYDTQDKEFPKRSLDLSEEYSRNIQKYEHMLNINKTFAAADARKFREMWLMIDAEVQQLVEKALLIDSVICKQHLGLPWERPRISCSAQGSQGSVEAQAGSRSVKKYNAATEVQRESDAEAEELSMETVKKVMDLLCDETGFLMEDKLLNLLTPLEKEEQTVVKLGSLITAIGIEEEDLPKLALFLLKYKQQQNEDGQLGASNLSSDPIHPNHVIPALKRFLEQHLGESSPQQQSSLWDFETWNSSDCKTYWESLGNTISKDRVQLWDAAESRLKQHLSVLEEISELIPETENLRQQNTELRMLLQQSLNSKVNTGLET